LSDFSIPALIRGECIEDDWVPFETRGRGPKFQATNAHHLVERLPLGSPSAMADLQEISFDEILDVLEALGHALDFETNVHIHEAYEAGLAASNYPPSLLKNSYITLPRAFAREAVREIAEQRVGIDYLEGWVEQTLADGRQVRVRAFGARALHIPAGNGGLVSAITIIRNAITRSDAIIKAPSNDPLTAMAIARTLAEIAPGHPLTRHLSVVYWRGGDTELEEKLLRPEHLEKIVAWGGFASVRHITRYLQPGLELIALDPKRSATIIGAEAFADEATLQEVARRAACDIGVANQEACASARVIHVLCGTDAAGLARADQLGQAIYTAMQNLPETISTKPRTFDRELRDHLDSCRLMEDWYRVIGGENDEGAVIVSRMDEPVDFAPMLSGRVANIVPVDSLDRITRGINAYTQTVGIYPESLKLALRDRLPLFGAQRLTSLGYACHVNSATPQDGIEPVRRMCKWVVDETCDPAIVPPMWQA
jgi:hypothetical protein